MAGNPIVEELAMDRSLTTLTDRYSFRVEHSPIDFHCTVHLSQYKMDQLELEINDPILLKGRDNRETVCRVLPSNDVQDSEIYMNMHIQNNLGVHLGDVITIKPCKDIQAAEIIYIHPLNKLILEHTHHACNKSIAEAIRKEYFGRPMHEQNVYYIVNRLGKTLGFKVTKTFPRPYCIFLPSTLIRIGDKNEHVYSGSRMKLPLQPSSGQHEYTFDRPVINHTEHYLIGLTKGFNSSAHFNRTCGYHCSCDHQLSPTDHCPIGCMKIGDIENSYESDTSQNDSVTMRDTGQEADASVDAATVADLLADSFSSSIDETLNCCEFHSGEGEATNQISEVRVSPTINKNVTRRDFTTPESKAGRSATYTTTSQVDPPPFVYKGRIFDAFEQHIRDMANGNVTKPDANIPEAEDGGEAASVINCLGDLLFMYRDGTFSDFELRTRDKVFRVHKCILGARSPFFKAIFMEDDNTGYIEMLDVDADVLDKVLVFLYSGTVPDLHWKTAVMLYCVADRFEVPSLKPKCLSFLQSNINVINLSNILLLVNEHGDEELKSVVHGFIFSHYDEIMSSDEWGKFIDEEGQLAAKVMHMAYMKRQQK